MAALDKFHCIPVLCTIVYIYYYKYTLVTVVCCAAPWSSDVCGKQGRCSRRSSEWVQGCDQRWRGWWTDSFSSSYPCLGR